jgi:Zn-dependent protease
LDPFRFIFGLPSIIIALTVHEFFHAYTAFRCGDPTAKYENRITLNPLAHFEPVGATLLFITLLIPAGIIIGWGKPVPVSERYLGNPRRDGILVALAGPMSNMCLAALAGIFFAVGIAQAIPLLGYFFKYFIMVNLGLCLFNLLPVPPLDGWNILQGVVPGEMAYKMKNFVSGNPMVMYIILGVLILSRIIDVIIGVPYQFLFTIFTSGAF